MTTEKVKSGKIHELIDILLDKNWDKPIGADDWARVDRNLWVIAAAHFAMCERVGAAHLLASVGIKTDGGGTPEITATLVMSKLLEFSHELRATGITTAMNHASLLAMMVTDFFDKKLATTEALKSGMYELLKDLAERAAPGKVVRP